MFVVVDLRSNPSFPLTATVNGALFGPYRNPKLKEWLIIGGNALARVIERTLRNVTRKNNVRWFKTEDEVRMYIVSSTAST